MGLSPSSHFEEYNPDLSHFLLEFEDRVVWGLADPQNKFVETTAPSDNLPKRWLPSTTPITSDGIAMPSNASSTDLSATVSQLFPVASHDLSTHSIEISPLVRPKRRRRTLRPIAGNNSTGRKGHRRCMQCRRWRQKVFPSSM